MIQAWNVDDEQGLVREITPESVADLWAEDATAIANVVSQANAPRTSTEEADFLSPVTTTSEAPTA